MKTAIIYDSIYGNTGKIAEAIAPALDASLVHISAAKKEILLENDCILIGTPTHGGRASSAVLSFFKELPAGAWKGKKVAVFSTGIPRDGQNLFLKFIIRILGYADRSTMNMLLAQGAISAGDPVTLMVKDKQGPLLEGEIEKALAWAKALTR
ncbi:MAG: flavodoxin family protein [Bacillota bacterium]